MTQEEVLKLIKTDSDKGMHEVTHLYTALVYKVVWGKLSSICNTEDIEETVSDVFLDFFRSYHDIDLSKGSLTSFIITLAQRRAVDVFRKKVRQQNIDRILSENAAELSFRTENTVMKNEERTILLNGIIELGEPDSTIIYRKFYYGETYEEIGNRLGLSANAVNKRYLKAINKLSNMMKGENFSD